MGFPAWIAEKIATDVIVAVFQNASASYNNTKAYVELKNLLEKAYKSVPSECKKGAVSDTCPIDGTIMPNTYNPKAGGTDTLNIYLIQAMNGHRYMVQFFDIQENIYIWEYDEKGKPLDKGRGLLAVDALAEIKKASGIGVEAESPHI